MERADRTPVAPAASPFTALAAFATRLITALTTPRVPYGPAAAPVDDIAFSDELERELIRRELHAR